MKELPNSSFQIHSFQSMFQHHSQRIEQAGGDDDKNG